MEKNRLSGLQEIVFASSDPVHSKQVSKLLKAGKLRKIAARLYSSNLSDSPEAIVRRNLFSIIGRLYPGTVLSHRSALEFQPTGTGQIFLSYTYTKKIALPGLTLRFLEGPGPIEGDNPLSEGLFAAQLERALLENMQRAHQKEADSKTLPQSVVEQRLEQIARVQGEGGLNAIRDRARAIAQQLGMQEEIQKLDKLIGALLATRPSKILESPIAAARALGLPYDPERVALFERLFAELKQYVFESRPERNLSAQAFRNFAFFEAYFSNYIEGTVFEIEEARRIIETNTPMPARQEDSHDVLGTFRLVSDRAEIQKTPNNAAELIEILQYRHEILLGARKGKNPGVFKDKNNRAGETYFVDYALVRGTLTKGYDFYAALDHPFAKAAFMMFLVSEVHPFLDGNGRIARVMMNAELVREGQCKIMIPTVFRDDYMGALRRLTRYHDVGPYIRMLARAHEFSATVVGADMANMERHLLRCNAFREHTEAKLQILVSEEPLY